VAFLLYSATALLVLGIAHRFVSRLSAAAAIVLSVLPLGLTGPALLTGRVYGPVDYLYQDLPFSRMVRAGPPGNPSATDVISEFFPWRLAVQESLGRVEWPLWNAYNLCGHPLAAEVQSAPYSPFTLLACLLPAPVSMTYTAAIALLAAAVAAFLFARELECGEAAALVAGAGWAFAASSVLYVHTAMGFTTLYLPLLLLATRRVIRAPGIQSGALLLTALVLTVLAGHPESLFLNVLTGCVYALFELVRSRATALRAVATAVAAGLGAALVCAISLLPLLEAIPQSVEYRMKDAIHASYGAPAAEVVAALATDVFPQLHLRQFVSPALGLIGAETAAVGSVVLALALYAIWRRRSPETWFFAALGLFCLAAGARFPPLVNFMRRLPLLHVTMHQRLAFAGALCLVMLAALGIEELLRRNDRRATAATLAVVLVLLGTGTFWIARHVVLGPIANDTTALKTMVELAGLAAAALLLASRIPMRAVLPILIAIVAGQRIVAGLHTFETYPASLAYPHLPLLDALPATGEPFRVVALGTAFPPATNTFYGLEDARGYEAMTLLEFQRTWTLWCRRHGIWFNRVDGLTAPFLSFLNVRFALQPAELPVPAGWRLVRADRGTALLENERAIARVFVPRRVAVSGASAEETVDRMSGAGDFADLAWITGRGDGNAIQNGPGIIELRSRSRGGEYRFDATMERDGWVVLSESAWKGWHATVDGRAVRLSRANAAFLAIPVPAGRHAVQVIYRPASFVAGRAISLATLALLGALAVFRASIRRRKFAAAVSYHDGGNG